MWLFTHQHDLASFAPWNDSQQGRALGNAVPSSAVLMTDRHGRAALCPPCGSGAGAVLASEPSTWVAKAVAQARHRSGTSAAQVPLTSVKSPRAGGFIF